MTFALFATGFGLGTAFVVSKKKKHKVIVVGVSIIAVLVEVFLLPK
ncbi:hypothetical protein P19_0204 [Aeromonas phage P19]|uniref:Integral membrane protein n=1 Tax=Aeromonas phage vB_AdhaM_G2 TaxID=3238786 RepID=A0AB39TZ40_9CAUD|nr:hypothetical protein P19_0204 [Aeromonas phage P19]